MADLIQNPSNHFSRLASCLQIIFFGLPRSLSCCRKRQNWVAGANIQSLVRPTNVLTHVNFCGISRCQRKYLETLFWIYRLGWHIFLVEQERLLVCRLRYYRLRCEALRCEKAQPVFLTRDLDCGTIQEGNLERDQVASSSLLRSKYSIWNLFRRHQIQLSLRHRLRCHRLCCEKIYSVSRRNLLFWNQKNLLSDIWFWIVSVMT